MTFRKIKLRWPFKSSSTDYEVPENLDNKYARLKLELMQNVFTRMQNALQSLAEMDEQHITDNKYKGVWITNALQQANIFIPGLEQIKDLTAHPNHTYHKEPIKYVQETVVPWFKDYYKEHFIEKLEHVHLKDVPSSDLGKDNAAAAILYKSIATEALQAIQTIALMEPNKGINIKKLKTLNEEFSNDLTVKELRQKMSEQQSEHLSFRNTKE